jgi:hypothetical protein
LSRYEIALQLALALGVGTDRVVPVSLHDIPGMQVRPLDTTMRCSRMRAAVDCDFRPLGTSILEVARNWRTASTGVAASNTLLPTSKTGGARV